MKPKEFEVIYKFTVAPTEPFPSALNWNAELIGELIRCKDCKHYAGGTACFSTDAMFTANEDGYCSWAERKEE